MVLGGTFGIIWGSVRYKPRLYTAAERKTRHIPKKLQKISTSASTLLPQSLTTNPQTKSQKSEPAPWLNVTFDRAARGRARNLVGRRPTKALGLWAFGAYRPSVLICDRADAALYTPQCMSTATKPKQRQSPVNPNPETLKPPQSLNLQDLNMAEIPRLYSSQFF